MYMPFGIGARTCAGQKLAMVELKVVLALLLSKFEFALSPNYVHCPAFRMTVEPGKGVRMAEWSKAPDSSSGPLTRAWVQIPLLT
ncbi:hypothetical protein EJB05_29842, partial [Eragrostis curvula]